MKQDRRDDADAIRALIARQFEALQWWPGRQADWSGFVADFLPGATLFPSARPVRPVPVPGFVERMRDVSGGELRSFEEALEGAEIRVFGNVAIAMAVCRQTENAGEPKRAVEALLLVRDDGGWRIAAQAWDNEAAGQPVPPELLDRPAEPGRR